ncbi:hypothetical protein TNCV_757451 [Trichonephila clavipes]|nr:hypothetical protein TNCV_757451 [Trichonephila clavipes]
MNLKPTNALNLCAAESRATVGHHNRLNVRLRDDVYIANPVLSREELSLILFTSFGVWRKNIETSGIAVIFFFSYCSSKPAKRHRALPMKIHMFLLVHASWVSVKAVTPKCLGGRCSLVVKASGLGWLVTSSSPVPLKIHRVGSATS